jgi:hypothetical protein
MSTHELARTALMVALCAAVGYLLSGIIPNLELISAAVFTCGVLTGVRRGALVGLLAESIYAGINRNGVSPPPLYAAQLLGFTLIGAGGGMWHRLLPRLPLPLQAGIAAFCGFLLTLAYDVLTNTAIWAMFRGTSSWTATMIGGLTFPFPLAHPLGNTVGFALVVPAVCRVWRRSPP